MKCYKGILLFYFLYAICYQTSPAASSLSSRSFSLVVREEFGSIPVGDLNTTLRSINTGYDEIRSLDPPWGCVGEIQAIPSNFKNWEAELQWAFWGGVSIGVAVSGPMEFHGNSFLTHTIVAAPGVQTHNIAYNSNIRVFSPLLIYLQKSFTIFRNLSVVARGGIGSYRANIQQEYISQTRMTTSDQELATYVYDVSGHCPGYNCGISFEYRLNKRFSLFTEGCWKFIKIASFAGDASVEDLIFNSDGELAYSFADTLNGILYHYYGVDEYTGLWREKLLVESLEPPWYGIDLPTDIRKAFLDLGGFTFKVGLKIRLF
jgi:hypothetical protein